MATFRTMTLPPPNAAAFEAQLRANGYRERSDYSEKALQKREYSKHTASSDPASLRGQTVVIFRIRD